MPLLEVVWPPTLSAEGNPLLCDTLACKWRFNSYLKGSKETLYINKCTHACLGYLKEIKVSIPASGHHYLPRMMNFGVMGHVVSWNSSDITNVFRKVTKSLGLFCLFCFAFRLMAPAPLYEIHRHSGNRPLLLEGQRRKKRITRKNNGEM